MTKKAGIAIVAVGAALILSALVLLLHNRYADARAGREAETLLAGVEAAISQGTADGPEETRRQETRPTGEENGTEPTAAEALDPEMPVAMLEGYGYVGYVEIPALGLKLPVMSDWDYTRLEIAPCRQFGSSRTDDLVIAAHNFESHFGRRKEMLQDIAVLTGGTVISSTLNMELSDAQMTDLGHCRQVVVTKDTTTIVDGDGTEDAIKERAHMIRSAIATTTSDYDREKLQERLAKLSGGVAVIKVGAQTEVAMKEQKLRVEDALNATRAAVEEGIVAGGGTAQVNAIEAVDKLIATLHGDEKTGARIIATALQAPIRQIAQNAGVDGSVVYEKIRNSGKVGYGYNAYTEEYVDMIPAGIVDPTKVTRSSLENAASIASCVLTTESLVVDKPDPAADAAAAAAAGQAGGMY